jgi:hypothetical protein
MEKRDGKTKNACNVVFEGISIAIKFSGEKILKKSLLKTEVRAIPVSVSFNTTYTSGKTLITL